MRASDLAGMSVGNLGRRKGRTVLTLTGVVIGVAALVMLVSLGVGLKVEMLKLFQGEVELKTIWVSRPGDAEVPSFFGPGLGSDPVGEAELEDLRKLPGVEMVVPEFNLFLEGRLDTKTLAMKIQPAVAEDEAVLRGLLVAGRMWSSPDVRECLLPSRLLEMRKLKPEEVVGKTLVFSRKKNQDPVDPRTFAVVGVVDSERMGLRGRQAYVPWKPGLDLRETTQGGFLPFGYQKDAYLMVEVRVRDPRDVDSLKRQIKNLNYEAISVADTIDMIDKAFLVVQGFMGAIGAIGVVVALFGIANTMTMSVIERTREIGIMKSLGARNRDIRRLFLLEAASIGLIGGLLGLALGTLASLLLAWIARQFNVPQSVTLFHVSWWLAVGAVAFAVVVSVVAGLVPALRASSLEPVRALRYE